MVILLSVAGVQQNYAISLTVSLRIVCLSPVLTSFAQYVFHYVMYNLINILITKALDSIFFDNLKEKGKVP